MSKSKTISISPLEKIFISYNKRGCLTLKYRTFMTMDGYDGKRYQYWATRQELIVPNESIQRFKIAIAEIEIMENDLCK